MFAAAATAAQSLRSSLGSEHRTPKHYFTEKMHINRTAACVCACMSACVFLCWYLRDYLSLCLASLYTQSRIFFHNSIRLWPLTDPPPNFFSLGHDTRPSVRACVNARRNKKRGTRSSTNARARDEDARTFRENCRAKKRGGREKFRTWSARLPMRLWGGGGAVRAHVHVRECVGACAPVHISSLQQTFIVQRGPLPWLQGFIVLRNSEHTERSVTVTSQWQSCGLQQTDTQSGPMRTMMMVVVVMMKEAAKGQARGGTLKSHAHCVMQLFYFCIHV